MPEIDNEFNSIVINLEGIGVLFLFMSFKNLFNLYPTGFKVPTTFLPGNDLILLQILN